MPLDVDLPRLVLRSRQALLASLLGVAACYSPDARQAPDASGSGTDGGPGFDSSLPPPPPDGSLPTWVNALPLWQWYAIPNTALSSVDPAATPPGYTGPKSKILAWCGATLRRKGSVYVLGAAGGHADYAGNEVDAIALNTETPRWIELEPPSKTDDMINGAQFYLDERPSATHTYYATQFIDSQDRMIVVASPGMLAGFLPEAPAGWPYTDAQYNFSFSFATEAWEAPKTIAPYPGNGDFTAALVAKHPKTDDIYYSRSYSDGWYKWTAATNTWSKLSDVSRGPWYAAAAIDPGRDRMLVVGGYSPLPPEVLALDGSGVSVTFGGLGAEPLTLSGYPGVVFDQAKDQYLVFANSDPISVYAVDAASFTVSVPAITGDKPAARINGIQNAVQYVPELRGVVIANAHDGPMYFMRTAP